MEHIVRKDQSESGSLRQILEDTITAIKKAIESNSYQHIINNIK